MKSKSLAVLTMVLGVALSTSVFAQGRHDEKPHGMGKASTESVDTRISTGSGRHDEKPHGMKKSVVKQDAAKAAADGTGSR